MQEQHRPRTERKDALGSRGLRGDRRDAADASWLCRCDGEAGTAAEGPAYYDEAGGAEVPGEVVESGADVGGAVVCLGGFAVVEADAGEREEEGYFVC